MKESERMRRAVLRVPRLRRAARLRRAPQRILPAPAAGVTAGEVPALIDHPRRVRVERRDLREVVAALRGVLAVHVPGEFVAVARRSGNGRRSPRVWDGNETRRC